MAVISDKIAGLLNYRIQQEEISSRLYKSMSIWLNKNGYMGAAKAWEVYSLEEIEHAEWAYKYLLGLNIHPVVDVLPKPEMNFNGLPNIIALSLKHELEVTEQCQELAKACIEENDFMALELAQRYLREQVEEVDKMTTLVDKLEAFGDSRESLRLLDNELGSYER